MRLAADLDRLTAGIAALRIVRALIREGEMGKLSAIADRIRDTKARLDAEADKLAARMDDIDKAAPAAFSRGHAFLTDQQGQVDEIEATLRQLSNLPLDGSQDSGNGSPIAQTGQAAPKQPDLETAPTGSPAAFVRRIQQP